MSVSQNELAGAAGQIRHTPQICELLLMGVSADDLKWKPQPSRFSISEVLAHVTHADEYCFGPRLRRMLSEEDPQFEDYQDSAFLDQPAEYLNNGPARLDEFVATRARWMKLIENVTLEKVDRRGRHCALGPVSVGELLHEWAFHDLGHVRQIAELLRARRFYPHIGAFQPLYTVRP
jgi:hypothetical protein